MRTIANLSRFLRQPDIFQGENRFWVFLPERRHFYKLVEKFRLRSLCSMVEAMLRLTGAILPPVRLSTVATKAS